MYSYKKIKYYSFGWTVGRLDEIFFTIFLNRIKYIFLYFMGVRGKNHKKTPIHTHIVYWCIKYKNSLFYYFLNTQINAIDSKSHYLFFYHHIFEYFF